MTNNCAYCKTPFRGERRTKMYCSDNCRQMAYLSRKGYLVTGNINPVKNAITVNNVKPNVKDIKNNDSVKYNSGVKYNIPQHGNETNTNEKYSNTNTLDGFEVFISKITGRIQTLEKTVEQQNHLLQQMWLNIKSDLEPTQINIVNEVRHHLEKHNSTLQQLNGINYCKPCNVKDFTPKAIVKLDSSLYATETKSEIIFKDNATKILQNQNSEPGFCNKTEDREDSKFYGKTDNIKTTEQEDDSVNEELKEAEQYIIELKEKLQKLQNLSIEEKNTQEQIEGIKSEENIEEVEEAETEIEEPEIDEEKEETQNTNAETRQTEKEAEEIKSENKYEFIIPELHLQIQKQLDKGDGGYRFVYPLSNWNIDEAQNVLWVNVRLLCLLNNFIKLGLRSHTNYETIATLSNSFTSLFNSTAYNNLPLDYPYINLIAEQSQLLKNLALNCYARKVQRIPVWMTIKRKSTIVTACTELIQGQTEQIRFRDLNFDEVKFKPAFRQQAKAFLKSRANAENY